MGGARLVDRGRLVDALDRTVTRRVTLISAPAGSGKTSLLRAWADRRLQTHRVAFVSAIRNTTGKSDVDEPLTATPGFNAGAMVDRVLSDLGRYGGRLVLVLDDVHELAPTVQTHLTRLLAELPAQVHAVLRFLPTNLSRSEIARELYLSVNTVSTHVRGIYAELDARDRSTAVEHARELRLLSAGVTR
jgi:LuxR family maltose regulon positive regulatory protein